MFQTLSRLLLLLFDLRGCLRREGVKVSHLRESRLYVSHMHVHTVVKLGQILRVQIRLDLTNALV